MIRFILPAAAALSLAVATPAFAALGTSATHQQSAQPAPSAHNPINLAQRHDRDRHRARDRRDRRDRARDHRDRRDRARDRHRYNWGDYHRGRRPQHWGRYNRNFNPRHWHGNIHARRRYHWGRYRYPHGWYYRRWVYGAILPSIFWGRNYWINSYWDFGLMDPPYGYVWVRYGPDAILVNVESGVILRTVYGVFY